MSRSAFPPGTAMKFRIFTVARCAPMFALAVAALMIMLTSCEEKIRPAVAPSGLGKDVPDQESWDATITFTDSGRVTGVLRAGYIAKFGRDRFTLLDSGITIDFYDENFIHTSVLTALRGRVNDVTNDLETRGSVVVTSDSGTVLRTEELHWDNRRGKVHTDAYVEIISPTEEIRGVGLESDRSLTNYTIQRVTGQAKPE